MTPTRGRHRDRRWAVWFSGPDVAAAEIASDIGYGAAVLDIEHGSFDLDALDRFIPLLRATGFEVVAKVLGPSREAIQQALDFGADVVVVPHISGLEHAREVTRFAKFPPIGDRSYAGTRTTRYQGFDDDWVTAQDTGTRCLPMIEAPGAFDELAAILELRTVDGVFVGPSDLSLSRGRGAYKRTEADFADLAHVAELAAAAGKPWVLPAWSPAERAFAAEHGADQIVLTTTTRAVRIGLQRPLDDVGARAS